MLPVTCSPILAVLFAFIALTTGAVVELNNGNIDSILKSNEVVFVNFYANWCRFSQHLKPIFAEASEKFKDTPAGKIVWAGVDADANPDIATKYHVNKYPTLKLFRNAELAKKEYRSQRSVEALTEFVEKQLSVTIDKFANEDELMKQIDIKRRQAIGRFPTPSGPAYENFQKVASLLREECAFHEGTSDPGQPISISFQPANAVDRQQFTMDANNFDQLKTWLTEKCIPLVREITFENAEELTEEGLPFLILFKLPDDKTSEKLFTDAVIRELHDQKTSINCLVADGRKFAHPLHHLGKGEKDLPVIAIDSFRHMYLFKNTDELSVAGMLRQFVMDLHSGKLHREFHNGPDPSVPQLDANGAPETQPPPSVFEKLKPSHNRYSFDARDEL